MASFPKGPWFISLVDKKVCGDGLIDFGTVRCGALMTLGDAAIRVSTLRVIADDFNRVPYVNRALGQNLRPQSTAV